MAGLRVEVVYARPDVQPVVALQLPSGSTVADAVRASGLAERFPDDGLLDAPVGIFSRVCGPETPLADGDRVEIYRPLQVDPKSLRRERAAAKD